MEVPYTLLRFARTSTKRFFNLSVILGLRIRTDYNLSAGQFAVLPSGKGNNVSSSDDDVEFDLLYFKTILHYLRKV